MWVLFQLQAVYLVVDLSRTDVYNSDEVGSIVLFYVSYPLLE